MPEVERRTVRYTRTVRKIYRVVFGETPDLEYKMLPGGDVAIVVAHWLWIFPSGIGDRWIVRCVLPEGDDWFAKFPCLAKIAGREIEKSCLMEAVVYLCSLESHRRVHSAIDGDPRLARMAHA